MTTREQWKSESEYPGLPARRLSALARAGFEVVSRPGSEVGFMVRHQVRDRPGLFLETISSASRVISDDAETVPGGNPGGVVGGDVPGASGRAEFAETVTASMNGASLIAVSALSREPLGVDRVLNSEYIPQEQAVCFSRSSSPNPTFLYDLAYVFEALIVLDPGSDVVTRDHAQILRVLVQEISRIASKIARVPILAMHFPAQVPSTALARDDSVVEWPFSDSLALRVSLALNSRSAEGRLELVKQLVSACRDSGTGLAVRDPRPGARSGNWKPIYTPHRWKTRSESPKLICMPATFVGPARVGSTNAIVEYLGRWPDVFISGCSIVSLNELAFVHLQLCREAVETKDEEGPNDRSLAMEQVESTAWWMQSIATNEPLGLRLKKLMGEFSSLDGRSDRNLESNLAERAGDYHSFFGHPFSISARGPDLSIRDKDSDSRRLGIWFSWLTSRGAVDLVAPLEGLEQAFLDALGPVTHSSSNARAENEVELLTRPPFNIDYLLCREVNNGRIRAIGKLSFDKAVRQRLEAAYPGGREATASVASRAIEDAWMARLSQRGIAPMELTVSWREMWLGHWSAPV